MRIFLTVTILLFSSISYAWVDAYVDEVKRTMGAGKFLNYQPNISKWGMNGNDIDLSDSDGILNQFCPLEYNFYIKFLDYIPNHLIPWANANYKRDLGLFSFIWETYRLQWFDIQKRMLICSKIKALQELKEKVKLVDVSAEKKVQLYEQIDVLEDCLRLAGKRSQVMACHSRHKSEIQDILN